MFFSIKTFGKLFLPYLFLGLSLGLFLSLFSCISHPTAPVTDLSPVAKVKTRYIVQSGDTLHAISFRTGIAYERLAKWNQISPPYKIFVGDVLVLRKPPKAKTKPNKDAPIKRSLKNDKKLASAPLAPINLPAKVSAWQWPSNGKLTQTFSNNKANYGISISDKQNSNVQSAAAGQVVYAGDAIKGYGRLIIIKHSSDLISAYAHNNQILVKEGDRVVAGQNIAKMGKTGTNKIKLHFEIRKNGEPVNPLIYLPKQRG